MIPGFGGGWLWVVRSSLRRDGIPFDADAIFTTDDRQRVTGNPRSPSASSLPRAAFVLHSTASPRLPLKVAVLIPLYNHERYIGAALASLRAQTRPPDRIIILDDGSTDGSLGALMALPGAQPPAPGPAPASAGIEPRIDILFQPNAGAHNALNRLVALADDCDYLAILNSDDCYHPTRLERCLDYLEAHPGIDLLCSGLRLVDESGQPLPADAPRARWFSAAWSFRVGTDGSSPLELAEWLGLANFPGTTSNFVARANYLRAHPFKPYRFAHDYYALVEAAVDNRLAVLDTPLLDYRVHGSNTISTEPERLIREVLRVNVDLARALAPRLAAEPPLRTAFARYQRAAWGNVSAFRADLFNLVQTEALALLPTAAVDALLASLDATYFPEIAQYPNRAVVNAHDPGTPALGPTSGLADKFYALKAQLSTARQDLRPWTEYRQLQAALLSSRWFALGQLFGCVERILRSGGKTAPEKLANLRERIAQSWWLKLGQRIGISSARRLLDAPPTPVQDKG